MGPSDGCGAGGCALVLDRLLTGLLHAEPHPHTVGCRSPANHILTRPAFPLQLWALTPLHIAAALPGEEGVQITELLLHAITDVDARAADENDVYRPDRVCHPATQEGQQGCCGPGASVDRVVHLVHNFTFISLVPCA